MTTWCVQRSAPNTETRCNRLQPPRFSETDCRLSETDCNSNQRPKHQQLATQAGSQCQQQPHTVCKPHSGTIDSSNTGQGVHCSHSAQWWLAAVTSRPAAQPHKLVCNPACTWVDLFLHASHPVETCATDRQPAWHPPELEVVYDALAAPVICSKKWGWVVWQLHVHDQQLRQHHLWTTRHSWPTHHRRTCSTAQHGIARHDSQN
jgi:hypothetical protein